MYERSPSVLVFQSNFSLRNLLLIVSSACLGFFLLSSHNKNIPFSTQELVNHFASRSKLHTITNMHHKPTLHIVLPTNPSLPPSSIIRRKPAHLTSLHEIYKNDCPQTVVNQQSLRPFFEWLNKVTSQRLSKGTQFRMEKEKEKKKKISTTALEVQALERVLSSRKPRSGSVKVYAGELTRKKRVMRERDRVRMGRRERDHQQKPLMLGFAEGAMLPPLSESTFDSLGLNFDNFTLEETDPSIQELEAPIAAPALVEVELNSNSLSEKIVREPYDAYRPSFATRVKIASQSRHQSIAQPKILSIKRVRPTIVNIKRYNKEQKPLVGNAQRAPLYWLERQLLKDFAVAFQFVDRFTLKDPRFNVRSF